MKTKLFGFLISMFGFCAGAQISQTPVLFPINSMFGGVSGQTITITAVNTLISDGINLYAGTFTQVPSAGTNPIVPLYPNQYLLTISGVVKAMRFTVPPVATVTNVMGMFTSGSLFYFGTNGFSTLNPGSGVIFVTNTDGSITVNSTASGGVTNAATTNGPNPVVIGGTVVIPNNYDPLGSAFTAQTNSLIVSVTGNDATGQRGTNAAQFPFASLLGAWNAALPNDVIRVTSGIYTPSTNSMPFKTNITVLGDGSMPTILWNGLGQPSLGWEHTFLFTLASNLHIEGLQLIDTNTQGFLCAIIGMATNTPYATNVLIKNCFLKGDGDTVYLISTNGGKDIVFDHVNADSSVDVYSEDYTNLTYVTLNDCRFFTAQSVFNGRRALKCAYAHTVANRCFFGVTNNDTAGAAISLSQLAGLCDVTLNNCTLSAPANSTDISIVSGDSTQQSPLTPNNVVEANGGPLTFTISTILKVNPNFMTGLYVQSVDSDNVNFLFGTDLGAAFNVYSTTDGSDGCIQTNTGSFYPMGVVWAADINYELHSASIAAPGFEGAGNLLTALNASQLTSGTIPQARLPATFNSIIFTNVVVITNVVTQVATVLQTNYIASPFYESLAQPPSILPTNSVILSSASLEAGSHANSFRLLFTSLTMPASSNIISVQLTNNWPNGYVPTYILTEGPGTTATTVSSHAFQCMYTNVGGAGQVQFYSVAGITSQAKTWELNVIGM